MENRNLKVVRKLIKGDLIIKDNIQFNNVNANSVIICENVTARLFGQIENLILKQGSCLFMHGLIHGKVENFGGELHLFPN